MIGPLFRVFASEQDPRDREELVVAQYKSLTKQIPLLYVILLSNAWMVALSHHGSAPVPLTLHILVILTGLCVARLLRWWRRSQAEPSFSQASRSLRATTVLAGLLAAAFLAWGLALYSYGTAFTQGQVAFFIGITVVGCVFCLIHLPLAALCAAVIVNIPFVVFLVSTGTQASIAVAVNIVLVSMAMLAILGTHYNDFASLIRERRRQRLKQAEIEDLAAENRWLANHNALTGLPNRHNFLAAIDAALSSMNARHAELFIAVVNLDGFRAVNDAFGNQGGDHVLMEAARRLGIKDDIDFMVFRLGGDEFGLVWQRPRNGVAAVLAECEEICASLAVPYPVGGVEARISATMGLSSSGTVAGCARSIHEAAQYALVHAKRNHRRGRVTLFTMDHQDAIRRHSILEQAMQTTDLDAELTLAFQPIVDVRSGLPIGFEALARWDSQDLGPVRPDEFIVVAERAGLANRLTCVLLAKALAVAATWPAWLRLSFNLSMQDICSSDSVLRLVAILNRSGVDPGRIDFEITETAVVGDFDQLVEAVTVLRAMGAGISLDDFGTGYSTLWQVNRLPLDKIKVDRSFVTNINESTTGYKIVKSVIALCRDMKINCVIEGVETVEELDTLRELDCGLVQGYYYSRPLPADAVLGYIDATFAGTAVSRRSQNEPAEFPKPRRRNFAGRRQAARRPA